jgi:hypothetical protein
MGEVCTGGACGIVCAAGQTTCGTGTNQYCSSLGTSSDCGACGAACTPEQDCDATGNGGHACSPCVPTVISVPIANAPTLPAGPAGSGGLKVTCDQATGYEGPCPVVVCGEVNYWFFSDVNNDENLYLVGYYPGNTVVDGPVTIGGNRYVNTATVNTGTQTVTINGQAGDTIEPWSLFQ